MIKNLKMCFTLSKYALNRGSMIAGGAIFFVLGIFMALTGVNLGLTAMYISLIAIMGNQMIQSVCVSAAVQSSPRKKQLQTTLPALFSTVLLIPCHTVLLLMQYIALGWNDYTIEELSNGILMGCGMYIIIAIYMAMAMKLFVPSTIVFFITFMAYYMPLTLSDIDGTGVTVALLPIEASIALSYVTLLVAGLLMYLINLATYRLPYSKVTWEAALKRAK